MRDRSALLVQVSRNLAVTPTEAPLALRLCLAVVHLLGLKGAAVSVDLSVPALSTLCATDEFVERLEDLQTVVGEGPALDAQCLGQAVVATPDEVPMRWPILARSLIDEGATPPYVLAVPMQPEAKVVGVLTLYADHPIDPTVDLGETQYLADAIAVAILADAARVERADELWSNRDRVNQATGMTIAQLRIKPDDALAVLRAHAFARGTSLSEIADRVLTGRLDFRAGDGPAQGDTEGDG